MTTAGGTRPIFLDLRRIKRPIGGWVSFKKGRGPRAEEEEEEDALGPWSLVLGPWSLALGKP